MSNHHVVSSVTSCAVHVMIRLWVWRPRSLCSITDRSINCVFSPHLPDRFWDPPIPHSEGIMVNSYGESGRGLKLTTHLDLVARMRIRWHCTSTAPYTYAAWFVTKTHHRIFLHELHVIKYIEVTRHLQLHDFFCAQNLAFFRTCCGQPGRLQVTHNVWKLLGSKLAT